jgi:IclR family transcriptional regulator, KDG regulon repressor
MSYQGQHPKGSTTGTRLSRKTRSKSSATGIKREQVTSVDRALTILELLAGKNQGMSTSDLSRRVHIPKSSMSYLLRTLVARGYVRRDAETGHHTLGIRLLSLGGQAMQGLELRDIAMPHLRHVVERTQLDTHLAILDHGDAVYVERIESPGFIKMATWIGRRMVPHVTGVGKALICCHERAAVEKIIAIHPLRPITPNTITTLSRLMVELEKTRQRGYAIDDEEHEARVRCVAAPVFAATGEVVAAIGVSGTVGQISDDAIPKIGNLIRSTALKFSAQLGARRGR